MIETIREKIIGEDYLNWLVALKLVVVSECMVCCLRFVRDLLLLSGSGLMVASAEFETLGKLQQLCENKDWLVAKS